MGEISLSKDSSFLRQLDLDNLKTYYVKIIVLGPSVEYSITKEKYLEAVRTYGVNSDEARAALAAASAISNEIPIREIQGRVSQGSLTIDGSSSVRRAGNITFLAEEEENDLTDIDNLLSMNKKVKVLVGFKNTIDKEHDDIIWFNQGTYVIVAPSLTHTIQGVNITLQLKDKMCMLNGDCGGGLPASVTFDSYDQVIGLRQGLSQFPTYPNNYTVYEVDNTSYMWSAEGGWSKIEAAAAQKLIGTTISVPQRLYDIIQTLVCNFGGEDLSKIIINDVALEIKNKVRYVGKDTLYYNSATDRYTLDETMQNFDKGRLTTWIPYGFNEDCGYIYTDLIYPSSSGLVSGIGETITSVLDKIKAVLGNYEYFYDLDGNLYFKRLRTI